MTKFFNFGGCFSLHKNDVLQHLGITDKEYEPSDDEWKSCAKYFFDNGYVGMNDIDYDKIQEESKLLAQKKHLSECIEKMLSIAYERSDNELEMIAHEIKSTVNIILKKE